MDIYISCCGKVLKWSLVPLLVPMLLCSTMCVSFFLNFFLCIVFHLCPFLKPQVSFLFFFVCLWYIDFESTFIIISFRFRGTIVHVPKTIYVGKSMKKVDDIDAHILCIIEMGRLLDEINIWKERRFYTLVTNGFKLILDDQDLRTAA